jgi:hypothetical protein
MSNEQRIHSILSAVSLDSTITGYPRFDLQDLNTVVDLDFDLPTNLRLGHLVEKIVSKLIRTSSNYEMIYENIQIKKDEKTIGEIDFIIEQTSSKQQIHLELAYKFYLLDPSISETFLKNWIGPNRNDSLFEKLEKLKNKQFPLLHNAATAETLKNLKIELIKQQLFLLASLYIPYDYKTKLPPEYQKAVKGHYMNYETFVNQNSAEYEYYLPFKKEWGIDPVSNKTWCDLESILEQLKTNLEEKQAPLCWQKKGDDYVQFFIVWW